MLDLERVKGLISDKIVFTLKTDADKLCFYQTPNLLTIIIRKNEKLYRNVGTPTDYYYTMNFTHLRMQQTKVLSTTNAGLI